MRTRMIRLVGTAVLLWVASLPAAADGWKLEADDYTADYTGASTANGMLGILPWKEPFSIRHVVLNHVFELNDRTGVNCAVRGIDPFSMTMRVDGREIDGDAISGWRQTIDMRRAEHTTTFVADGKLRVAYSVIALCNMPYAALIDVEVTALQDAEADFRTAMQVPEGEYRTSRRTHRSFLVDGHPTNILRTDARTAHGRYDVSASSMFIPACEGFGYEGRDDAARLRLRLKAGETKRFTLAGAVCTTRDFSDPYSESERQVIYIAHESVDRVLAGHRRLWDEMWQGDIEIEGDDEAQRVVRFALYNLYASCRAGSRLSIPPMGLSSQGYNGHIFWDAELWMYPPMLLLNEGIARSMVDYRTDRLAAARRRASAYGYRGVMFPWESDWFGEESTPTWAITGPMEHHITADVGIAAWNYYCVTRDREWLRTTGWPLLKEIAAFWVSRVVRNDDGSYSIAGVVGADEYAMNVTDNAFTNGAAKVVLCNAVEAARACGEKAPVLWSDIADGLRILRDDAGVTLEYAGYAGQQIKQADVNLLGYPLGVVTDRGLLLRDLAYYDAKIDRVNGPAMAFSVFCVQYAWLGDAAKAEEMFRRCYRPNLRPPFGVLAETPTSHNPYFTTCAGGMLQAVMNGFGGLEITDKGIVCRETALPASWKRLTIKGVGPERRTYVINNP